MKISVQQMCDWNSYAYVAEEVDPAHWEFFQNSYWWQVGSTFLKVYDNVEDFSFCAENYRRYGETAVRQQLKLEPAPWEEALERLLPEMDQLGVEWFLHGSAAMALWGMDVAPKDVNVILPHAADFEKVRRHFARMSIRPFERCGNWVMSALGDIFLGAVVGFAFYNADREPFDPSGLGRVPFRNRTLLVSSLEMLLQDNQSLGRPERIRQIEERVKAEEAKRA